MARYTFAEAVAADGKDIELRGMLRYLMLRFGDAPLRGAEVGVWKGQNAINYMRCLAIQHLYLVDPYSSRSNYTCAWVSNEQRDFDEAFQTAQTNIAQWGFADQVEFIRRPSVEAAPLIPNDLDFVYIDGDHGILPIYQDIATYWPKVKWGGVIGGHDFGDHVQKALALFLDRPLNEQLTFFPDQANADQFVGLYFTGPPYQDWWLVKEDWRRFLSNPQSKA